MTQQARVSIVGIPVKIDSSRPYFRWKGNQQSKRKIRGLTMISQNTTRNHILQSAKNKSIIHLLGFTDVKLISERNNTVHSWPWGKSAKEM